MCHHRVIFEVARDDSGPGLRDSNLHHVTGFEEKRNPAVNFNAAGSGFTHRNLRLAPAASMMLTLDESTGIPSARAMAKVIARGLDGSWAAPVVPTTRTAPSRFVTWRSKALSALSRSIH